MHWGIIVVLILLLSSNYHYEAEGCCVKLGLIQFKQFFLIVLFIALKLWR